MEHRGLDHGGAYAQPWKARRKPQPHSHGYPCGQADCQVCTDQARYLYDAMTLTMAQAGRDVSERHPITDARILAEAAK